jgi:acyl-[acyl carrier protein]--UDP-N-acetylglucosamine O-acyltransferase
MIHPTALIDPSAVIGANVSIGAYSVIGADVYIGEGTVIGPHVVIEGPTRIGRENRIAQFTSLGGDPQDKKFAGERTELVIGDRNLIRHRRRRRRDANRQRQLAAGLCAHRARLPGRQQHRVLQLLGAGRARGDW